jgi:S1-C subfamily serine protease
LENNTNIGDTVQLTVLRGGKELTVPVTVGEEPQ